MTIGCVLIPRFSLIAATGDRREILTQPVALAPEPGGEQAIGETSGAAEAFGIRAGMPLSEALSRCPGLILVPPDPGRAALAWERSLQRLEGIGAEVEAPRAGEVFFAIDGLRGLWGPHREGVLAKAGKAVGGAVRLGAGPTRFCAYAVASNARPRRRPVVVARAAARGFLAPLGVSLLAGRLPGPAREAERLVGSLERLGVATLGDLAGLPRIAIADRFGELGLSAHDLASGTDTPLRPRRPHEELVQALGLPEAAYGTQLDRALELLIERLVADPRRKGRTIRLLRLEARLAGGGSWRAEVAMRSATASPERLGLALGPKLAGLPAPAATLALRALELGPEGAEQHALAPAPGEERRERLSEAVRQARAAGGRDALLRIVDVEPGSRIPERRAMLVPHTP
jgi:protein ImuB